jgi:hypothetical protein
MSGRTRQNRRKPPKHYPKPAAESAQTALTEDPGKSPTPPKGQARFRWAWILFLVLATSVPYLVNWYSTPAGCQYTWIQPPYPEDSFAYMAWSQQAAHGNLLFHVKFTAIPHSAFLFNPFFLVCGWISSLLDCNIAVVHWAAKAAGVVFFFLAFFKYTDYLALNRFQSILASILVGVSSGFGGLLALVGLGEPMQKIHLVPADVWVVDANTYWSLLWNPLFPYSLTLMLLSIYWLDRGTRNGRMSDLWRSGLSTGVLALVHPYSQPLLFALAVAITWVRRRKESVAYLGRFFLAVVPFALYVVLLAEFDPMVSRHNAQGEMPSPSLVSYALGFGLPLLACLAGIAAAWKLWVRQYWQVLLWFLLCLGFCYLPFWFQRKFIFGAHIPLCILAAISTDALLQKFFDPRHRKRVVIAAAVVLLPVLVSTPVYLLLDARHAVQLNLERSYFISNDLVDGLDYLKRHTRPEDVVFANVASSRLIPAFAGNTVLWGHWAMSVDFEQRKDWFADLFHKNGNWNDEKRRSQFWGNNIRYIFADGAIRKSMYEYPWAWRIILAGADKVFANDSVVIYRRPERPPAP